MQDQVLDWIRSGDLVAVDKQKRGRCKEDDPDGSKALEQVAVGKQKKGRCKNKDSKINTMTYHSFEIKIIKQTDKAVLVEFREFDDEEIWIPWSCIENNNEDVKDGYEGRLYVAEWFAQREGLI